MPKVLTLILPQMAFYDPASVNFLTSFLHSVTWCWEKQSHLSKCGPSFCPHLARICLGPGTLPYQKACTACARLVIFPGKKNLVLDSLSVPLFCLDACINGLPTGHPHFCNSDLHRGWERTPSRPTKLGVCSHIWSRTDLLAIGVQSIAQGDVMHALSPLVGKPCATWT